MIFKDHFSCFFQAKKRKSKKRIKRNLNCADKTAPWILLWSGLRKAITQGQRVAPRTRPPAFKSDSIAGQTWDSGQVD